MKFKSRSKLTSPSSVDFRLKRLSRVQLIDRCMTLLFTLSGWAVMVAVIGMGVFFLKTVVPLAQRETLEVWSLGSTDLAAGRGFISVVTEPGIPFVGLVDSSCQLHITHRGAPSEPITLPLVTDMGVPTACYEATGTTLFARFSSGLAALVDVYYHREFPEEDHHLGGGDTTKLHEMGFLAQKSHIYVKPYTTSALAQVTFRGHILRTVPQSVVNSMAPMTFLSQMQGSLLFSNAQKVFTLPLEEKNLFPVTHTPAPLAQAFLLNSYDLWRVSQLGDLEVFDLTPKFGKPIVNVEPHATLKLGFPIVSAALIPGSSSLFFMNTEGYCGVLDLTGPVEEASPMGVPTTLWLKSCHVTPGSFVSASPRGRIVLTHSDTQLTAWETTTGRVMFELPFGTDFLKPGDTINAIRWAQDGRHALYHATSGEVYMGVLKAPHPEASWQAFFMPVHYEGYEEPGFVWQSTGSDTFQPKYSLVPLMWGTLKATFYAIIFAAPLGIFAAIYSSEILDRKTRNHIKPAIEMMASLPSVVLGYIAALYVAPWVEKNVVSVLCLVLLTPMVLYTMGNAVGKVSSRYIGTHGFYSSRKFLVLIVFATLLGLLALLSFGHWVESTAFGGDVTAFLSGGHGHAGVLWGLFLLPFVFGALWSIPLGPYKKIGHFILFCLGPWLAWGLGTLIAAATDPRDIILGPYAQRNTLVVALVMGFAIVPIIYSIAEDALTSVPSALRAASLACGASVWQTTARVVVPTAASGLFTAVTIGFGRAIGETMIAVMAAGNSPTIDVNPFEGLRSLSANIAVELPEASFGGTHYRVLFLSALILFLFTFSLNSIAEMMRSKYRARSQAL